MQSVFGLLTAGSRTGRRFGLEAFQLVLCDENRLTPRDDGCDPQYRRLRPQLFLAPEVGPHASRMLAAAGVL